MVHSSQQRQSQPCPSHIRRSSSPNLPPISAARFAGLTCCVLVRAALGDSVE